MTNKTASRTGSGNDYRRITRNHQLLPPEVLLVAIAVNPVTNKIYVANYSAAAL